jgi:hypothetical protein
MTRKYVTYTHEIAPGLLLTVETLETWYRDEGQKFPDDQRLEGVVLHALGHDIDLLWELPPSREPYAWLEETNPEGLRLVDLTLVEGKQVERAVPESEAA